MISFSMLIISSIILLIMNFKKFSKPEPIEYLIGLVFIFIFCIWYLSPEIRYVSGLIISAGTILIVYIIFNAQLNNKISSKYMTICLIILSGLLIYKNTKYFKVHHLFEYQTRIFNYSHIFKVGNFDGYEVFASNIWQCAEFKGICLNKPKKKYHFTKQNGYFFILRESKE